MSDYKAAKEAFVADNPGSSVHHINAISITALTAYAVYATTSRRYTSPVLDWLTIVLPLLLGVTVFADVPLLLNCALVGLAVLLGLGGRRNTVAPKPAGQWLNESDSSDEDAASDIGTPSPRYSPVPVKLPSELVAEEAQKRHSLELSASLNSSPRRRSSPAPLSQAHAAIDISSPVGSPDTPGAGGFGRAQTRSLKHRKHKAERERQDVQAQAPKAHLPFLTVYRAHMMVMTVHCILAVDFSVFPRVLGKCEDFGTSLMDVGVGSFVFSLGIVSSKSFSGRPASPWIKTCIKALRTAAPVLALGFIRLLMVKGVEYPEHLTEYGVHWNFFFTLGLVPALCSMLLPLRRHVRWHALAIAIALAYQVILLATPLQAFLLSSDRPGLLGANKEGLASVPGYLAVFMVGLSAGERVLRAAPRADGGEEDGQKRDEQAAADRAAKRRTELALELAGYAAMAWATLGACYALGIMTSRRFANLPYVLWTVAYNTSYLTGYLALELFLFASGEPACPPLLEAVNRNGLAVFLVANLLTGLINVAFQTMYASTSKAMLILAVYSAGVCAVAWLLRGVRIKL